MKAWLEQAAGALGADGAALYRNSEGFAVLVAWVGEEPRPRVPFGLTPVGECAATGIALRREVRGTKPGKYHSHALFPLFRGGTQWGVLSFSSVEGGHFDSPSRLERARELARAWADPDSPGFPGT